MKAKLLIIIDGPDRTGKGTICNYFRDNLTSPNTVYIHLTKPPSTLERLTNFTTESWGYERNLHTMNAVDALFKAGTDVVIMDRSYISEFVYGTLYRGAEYTDIEFAKMERAFLSELESMHDYNVNLIVTADNNQRIEAREDGESPASSLDDITAEVDMFINFFNQSAITHKHLVDWRTTKFNSETLAGLLSDVLLSAFDSTVFVGP